MESMHARMICIRIMLAPAPTVSQASWANITKLLHIWVRTRDYCMHVQSQIIFLWPMYDKRIKDSFYEIQKVLIRSTCLNFLLAQHMQPLMTTCDSCKRLHLNQGGVRRGCMQRRRPTVHPINNSKCLRRVWQIRNTRSPCLYVIQSQIHLIASSSKIPVQFITICILCIDPVFLLGSQL